MTHQTNTDNPVDFPESRSREAFEKWLNHPKALARYCGNSAVAGHYVREEVQMQWEAWRAAQAEMKENLRIKDLLLADYIKFDPESYTITIRKEEDDGEILYVGRVAEFPNISAYEETFEAARSLVIDSIQTLKMIADKTEAEFPLPYPAPSARPARKTAT